MKFCPVVPKICRRQVHGPRKERRKRIIIIIIIRRNGAKTISLQQVKMYIKQDVARYVVLRIPPLVHL
jgi:hypothetical protein